MILVYQLLEPCGSRFGVQPYGMDIGQGRPMSGTRYPGNPRRLLDRGMPGLTLKPIDRKILLSMLMRGNGDGSDARFRGKDAQRFLKLLCQTGRCYCWANPAKPLAMDAQPLAAPLVWTKDGDALRPAADLPEETLALPTKPVVAVRLDTATIHELRTQNDEDVTWAWMTTPPMPPERTAEFTQSLTTRHPRALVPAPPGLEHVVLDTWSPTPALHLCAHRPPAGGIHMSLQLMFLYGEQPFPPATSRDRVRFFDKGRMLEAPRNLEEEDEALAVLKANGLRPPRPLDSRDLFAATADNDEWEPDEGSTWSQVLANLLPELEDKGWRVTHAANARPHLPADGDWYAEFSESKRGSLAFEQGVRVQGRRVNLLPALHGFLQKRKRDSLEEITRYLESHDVTVDSPEGLVVIAGTRFLRMVRQLHELFGAGALDAQSRLRLNPWRATEIAESTPGNWTPPPELRQAVTRLRGAVNLAPLSPPESFAGELRAYQSVGLAWLDFIGQTRLGGILADDMGLGKTVQILAFLSLQFAKEPDAEPVLIVCPSSVLPNWRAECKRFVPGLRTAVMHGADRHDDPRRIESADILLTPYALMWRDQRLYEQMNFSILVLDEAQALKNPKSRSHRAACALDARIKLAVTGTPCENHLGDLWALFNIVLPGFLGGEREFRLGYRRPIEQEKCGALRRSLQNRVRPLVLRRTKEVVAPELPPKTEIIQRVPLSDAQTDMYQTLRAGMSAKIQEEMSSKGRSQSRFTILEAMMKLRQTCCDPRLVNPRESYNMPEDSAKLAHLMEILPELVEEGRRVLLFSQFTSMLDLIKPELKRAKLPHVEIRGSTRDRETPVRRFQAGEVPLFLLSLKAGGTGLNLTAADTVIHYDPWWNPAVEAQATDRAHRIGQVKPVFVYKLVAEGSLEKTILDMQNEKRELAGLLEPENGKAFTLNEADLNRLLAPLVV